MIFSQKQIAKSLIVMILILGISSSYTKANAAALQNKSDTMTSQKISTTSDHTIVFRTPSGANLSTHTITLTFPAGFNMNSIGFISMDLAHSAGGQSNCNAPTFVNVETLAAAPTAVAWGATLSGQVITFLAPTDGIGAAAMAANACVQIKLGQNAVVGGAGTTQIINPGSTGSNSIVVGGVFGDTGNIVVNILTDDQVAVTAVVPETLTFTISSSTIGFGTLTSASARFATNDSLGSASEVEAHNIVVGTNAANGYTMTATGTTLTYGINTINAIGNTNTASAIGTEQFGLRMTATGGTGTVSAPYAAAGFAYNSTTLPTTVATAVGASANTTYSVRYLSNIAALTEAGRYTTAITYSATANF